MTDFLYFFTVDLEFFEVGKTVYNCKYIMVYIKYTLCVETYIKIALFIETAVNNFANV